MCYSTFSLKPPKKSYDFRSSFCQSSHQIQTHKTHHPCFLSNFKKSMESILDRIFCQCLYILAYQRALFLDLRLVQNHLIKLMKLLTLTRDNEWLSVFELDSSQVLWLYGEGNVGTGRCVSPRDVMASQVKAHTDRGWA